MTRDANSKSSDANATNPKPVLVFTSINLE